MHYRPENRISAVQYDKARRQLLTASVGLKPWPLRNWDLSRSGQCHGDVVACALYNANFHQVCTPRKATLQVYRSPPVRSLRRPYALRAGRAVPRSRGEAAHRFPTLLLLLHSFLFRCYPGGIRPVPPSPYHPVLVRTSYLESQTLRTRGHENKIPVRCMIAFEPIDRAHPTQPPFRRSVHSSIGLCVCCDAHGTIPEIQTSATWNQQPKDQALFSSSTCLCFYSLRS